MIKITNKNRKIAVAIIISVTFTVLMGLFLFRPNNAEILVPGNIAMTVDGLNVSVGFYNYFYSASTSPEILLELEKQYEDFDQNIPLDEQIYDAKTGETWSEYTRKTVEEQITSLIKAYNEGIKAGVFVFDEQQKNIDTIIKALESEAKELSIGTSDYTGYTYGDYVGVKTVRKILEMSYIAQNYYEYFVVNNTLSQEDYKKFFENNKTKLISVEYFCCEFTVDEKSLDEAENAVELLIPELSSSNFEKILKKNFSEFSLSFFKGRNNLLYFEGSEKMKNWLFDDCRKAGDKIVIADEEEKRLYVVLVLKEPKDELKVTCSAREIAMRVSDFGDWDSLEKTANEIEAKIKEADNKEFAFAVYADIYMNNIKSDKYSGGLVTNLENGDGEAEKWLFDSDRKREDFVRLKTENGYYLIMYVERKPSWQFYADEEIKSSEFKKIMKNSKLQKRYAFRFTEGYS